MLKIELPQPETALPEESTAGERAPGPAEGVPDGQRPWSEKRPGTTTVAGTAYRRTFACVAMAGSSEDAAKT